MDDKVFASANMTAAISDDPSGYESIPTVNVFDNDLEDSRTLGNLWANTTRNDARQDKSALLTAVPVKALALVPLAAAGYLLLSSCQGGGY